MKTVPASSEAVELLSSITSQKLSQKDVTPSVLFLAAVITVMLGVVFADGTVTDSEKKEIQTILNRFNLPEGDLRQLTKLLLKGIQQHKIYTKIDCLLTLTELLSVPEKLLLVSFSYKMCVSDGELDFQKQQYLESIAERLGINSRRLAVLKAALCGRRVLDTAALDELQSLLDPVRFQSLGMVFVNTANQIIEVLPSVSVQKETQPHKNCSYENLKVFYKHCQQLDNFCYQLFQIAQDCSDRGFLSQSIVKEIKSLSQKIQNQQFRVAIVGEFSQGKSTVINALLGEKIQPVRAIPCSGVVTILKHGFQKRIICRYKNGEQKEIPFEQYQTMAAIPKEAALDCPSKQLINSEIDEIVFEHPNLELCRNGVEIIDSPGLNEHPERSIITQKLLKDIDAVIFLANASRPLTKWEQDYLSNDLRISLNGGKDNEPANNIFILVNFVDLLDEEEDRRDVMQRFESFVSGKNPIVRGDNRIHFISAKATLQGIVNRTENDYVKVFKNFICALDKFLTTERGYIKIQHSGNAIKTLVQSILSSLSQAENTLDGKLILSEAEKQKILEQIGEASGRDFIIQDFADQLVQNTIQQICESWNIWTEGLADRIADKSANWNSKHSSCEKEKLFQDYANQFTNSLSKEIDDWWKVQAINEIVKPHLNSLNQKINHEIEAIKSSFQLLDSQLSNQLNEQFDAIYFAEEGYKFNTSSVFQNGENEEGGFSIGGGLGAGGLTVGALLAFTGIGLVPLLLAGGAAAVIGSFIFGGSSEEELHYRAKQQVYDLGFEKFNESVEEIFNKIEENTASVFYSRVEQAEQTIEQLISSYENILEQQEKVHKETLEQRETEKAFISQQRRKLEQVKNEIDAILNQYVE